MSKRKSSCDRTGDLMSLELDEEQIAALSSYQKTRQAIDFKRTTAAAKALDVDYKEDDLSYVLNLKTEHLQDSGQLSEHFALVIKDLKNSDYVSVRHDESFCRNVLDLIIIDRLRHLEDRDVHHRLQVSAEVPVSIRIKDVYGNNEVVKGRADWALGYGTEKSGTGAVLLIVEAKAYESAAVGMPQLLVYMAGVYEARARQDRVNKSVFGMVSDSKEFRFSFLNGGEEFFTTRPYTWVTEQSTIIAYIDMMLIDAIESSPHTTPQKKNNKYPEVLERQWRFGTESDDVGAGDKEETEYDMVDVLNIGGRVVMGTSMHHGRPSSLG